MLAVIYLAIGQREPSDRPLESQRIATHPRRRRPRVQRGRRGGFDEMLVNACDDALPNSFRVICHCDLFDPQGNQTKARARTATLDGTDAWFVPD